MERRRTAAAALEDLFAHEAWLRRVAGSLARHDPGAADDLVQETWIAAMRRPPEDDRPVRPWLARVVRNVARMRYRGETRRTQREQQVVAEAVASPETLTLQLEEHRRLTGVILELDEARRQVLLLSFGSGLTSAQIGEKLGVPAGTVRWRLKSALDELRDKLGYEPRRSILSTLVKGLMILKTKTVALGAVVVAALLYLGARHWVSGSQDRSVDTDKAVVRAVAKPPKVVATEETLHAPPPWLARQIKQGRRVAGRVVRASDGTAVAGARVQLSSDLTDMGAAGILERVTGADGRFDFGPQAALQSTVSAAAKGLAPDVIRVDLRGPGRKPNPDRLELKLEACTATIVGEVTDDEGAPLVGARVGLWDNAVTTRTGEDGGYELCTEEGTTFVTARFDGMAPVKARVAAKGKTRRDFELTAGVPVTVSVARLDDGTPVADVHVVAVPMGQQPEGALTTANLEGLTDEAGRLRFENVLPANLRFEAFGDGVRINDYQELYVEAGKKNEVQLLVETMARVSGTVHDERGRPVVGASISALKEARTWDNGEAVTQEDGSFTLPLVPFGEQILFLAEHKVVTPQKLQVEGDITGLDVRVDTGRRVSGVVRQDGKGLAGARLMITREGGGRTNAMTVADEEGRFSLSGLEPAKYTLLGMVFDGVTSADSTKVDLTAGDVTDVVVDVAGKPVTGVVVDEDGAPVAGAMVSTTGAGKMIGYDRTNSDGSFKLRAVNKDTDGTVTVRLDGDVLEPATPFPPLRGGMTGVRLVVRMGSAGISGFVVDDRGAAVPGAVVEAARSGAVGQGTTSDATGAFRLNRLPGGVYEVLARGGDGRRGRLSSVATGRNDLRLVLAGGATVAGTVSGFTGGQPEVRVQDLRPPYDVLPASVKDGRFEATGLAPGDYVVTAQTAQEQAVGRVSVASGARAEVQLTAGGSGTISGTLVELGTGQPIAGAMCRTVPRSGDVAIVGAGSGVARATTDERGGFTLKVPAGELRVSCLTREIGPSSATLTVAPGATATVQLALPRPKGRGDAGLKLDPWTITARVITVDEGGPAAQAGLRVGDQISAVDGVATGATGVSAASLIAGHPAGTTVEITTQRGVFHLTLAPAREER